MTEKIYVVNDQKGIYHYFDPGTIVIIDPAIITGEYYGISRDGRFIYQYLSPHQVEYIGEL